MTKATKEEKAVLTAWQRSLAGENEAVLNRICKAVVRHFVLEGDEAVVADLEKTIVAEPAEKAAFIVSFFPVFGDDGLIAFLTEGSPKWRIAIPEASAGTPRAGRKGAAAPAPEAAAPRAKATTRSADAPAPRKPRAASTEEIDAVIPGKVSQIVEAMGLRGEVAPKGRTLMNSSTKFQLLADPALGLVMRCTQDTLAVGLRYLRKTLSEKQLSGMYITSP